MIERFFVFADPVSEHWFGSVTELCDDEGGVPGALRYMRIEIAAPDGESTEAVETFANFTYSAAKECQARTRFLALQEEWVKQGAALADEWDMDAVCGKPYPEPGMDYCSERMLPGDDMCPVCLREAVEE